MLLPSVFGFFRQFFPAGNRVRTLTIFSNPEFSPSPRVAVCWRPFGDNCSPGRACRSGHHAGHPPGVPGTGPPPRGRDAGGPGGCRGLQRGVFPGSAWKSSRRAAERELRGPSPARLRVSPAGAPAPPPTPPPPAPQRGTPRRRRRRPAAWSGALRSRGGRETGWGGKKEGRKERGGGRKASAGSARGTRPPQPSAAGCAYFVKVISLLLVRLKWSVG